MVMRRNREEWKTYGNVFDKHSNGLLFKLASQGHFDELKSAIALGKEANVFTATSGRESERAEHLIVKIYRLENCNFKKMYEYLKHDPRYMHTKPRKRFVVFSWCQREFRNLMLAREAGVRCPTPIIFKDNILIMNLIGDAKQGVAARMLKDQAPEEPAAFAELTLKEVRKLWKHGLVHGDLSSFNILIHNEKPYFIDFSQSSPTNAPNARELLERDLKNIATHFKKLGVEIDIEKQTAHIQKA